MNLRNQKRLSAQIMKCGTGRVWMNPDSEEDIKAAITKDDIRSLISKGVIRLKQEQGVSRGRARENMKQKRKGLRKGMGSRKGRAGARTNTKDVWVARIRALRAMFVSLKSKGIITNETYSSLRHKSKGGLFRSRRHVMLYLQEHNLLKVKTKK
ncbi:MAG: 50S ribosomal protein L19e [archaeon]|nr:50S ribosomal protein L19e [archaeon]